MECLLGLTKRKHTVTVLKHVEGWSFHALDYERVGVRAEPDGAVGAQTGAEVGARVETGAGAREAAERGSMLG